MNRQTESLPHSMEAEKALLGSMLLDPERVVPDVTNKVNGAEFYSASNAVIFLAMETLLLRKLPIDLVTLTTHLKSEGWLEQIGGAAYLAELFTYVPTAGNWPAYLETVQEKAALRLIATTCQRVASDACEPMASPTELAATLAELMGKLTASRPREPLTMKQHVTDALERYEATWKYRGSVPAGTIPTDLGRLDEIMDGGLHAGDLVVIAAETSGGKTAMALQLAAQASVGSGRQSLVISYEMPCKQLTDRLIAQVSNVAASQLRSGRLTGTEFTELTAATPKLANAGIHLRDGVGQWTIADIASEARAIKAKHGLDMLVVDYLQLVAPVNSKENRERQVAEVSRGLKTLATELNIVVLALSQLNDEGRLRESRAIGQDADVVLLIADSDAQGAINGDKFLRIEKNRHGASKTSIPAKFVKHIMRFE